MRDLIIALIYNVFSIPFLIVYVILALLELRYDPPTPRFRTTGDIQVYASEGARKACDGLAREAGTHYFDYAKCYSEKLQVFSRFALDQYRNPPEMSDSLLGRIFKTRSGVLVLAWLPFGIQITLYRLWSKDPSGIGCITRLDDSCVELKLEGHEVTSPLVWTLDGTWDGTLRL